MTNCLCGHFEWCEVCTTKPDDPEVLKRMKAKDWAFSLPVDVALPPPSEALLKAFKVMHRTIEEDIAKILTDSE